MKTRCAFYFVFICVLNACGNGPQVQPPDRKAPDAETWNRLATKCQDRSMTVSFTSTGEREVNVVHNGNYESLEVAFAEGTVCIPRPIRTVWGVLATEEGVQWTDSKIHGFKAMDPSERADFDLGFLTFQRATKPPRPPWHMKWMHRVIEGERTAPTKLQIQFEKTTGTAYIQHFSGQILMQQVDAESTAVFMELELKGNRLSNLGVDNCTGGVTTQIERLATLPPDFNWLP